MTPETDRFRTLGNRVSWLLVPYVAVAQFATLGTPVVKLVYPAIGITWLTVPSGVSVTNGSDIESSDCECAIVVFR